MRRKTRALITVTAVVALSALAWAALATFRPHSSGAATQVLASPPTAGSSAGAVDPILVSAINGFGFELLGRTAASSSANANVVLSPLSIHAALAMAGAGAGGNTAAQMRRTLRVDALTPAVERVAYADLLVQLASREQGQLALANSLWVDQGAPIKESFLASDRRYFGAEEHSVDLSSKDTMDQINAWASKNTNGRIPQFLTSPPPAGSMMELLNATYFLGKWSAPFDPSQTSDQTFHRAAGSTETVRFMHQSGDFRHVQTADYEAVLLPYRGNSASMAIVLPSSSSSLSRLMGSLDASGFAALSRSLSNEHGSIALPKVETRWTSELVPTLAAMGMPDAFSRERADFSAMTDWRPTWIDRVLHKTYFRVDEQGTEAAAVSMVEVAGMAAAPPRPFDMVVDRPYLMAITDNDSGAILFSAAIGDPSAR
jgi:serine protease inhibitor